MASPYDEILAHLQANVSSTFAPIEFLDNIEQQVQQVYDKEAALLITPVSLAAAPTNTTVGAVTQNATLRIAFLIAYQSGVQGEATNKFPVLYEAVRNALLGFTPNQYYDPMVYEEGEGLSFGEKGLFVWQDIYATSSFIRQA